MVHWSYYNANCNLPETSYWHGETVESGSTATTDEITGWCQDKIKVQKELYGKKWHFHSFGGLSGIKPEGQPVEAEIDLPGFVAVNVPENMIVIVFHGSRSNADWVTNLLQPAARFPDLGFGQHLVHHGYGLKLRYMKKSLYTLLRYILLHYEDLDQSKLWWMVTGHSQGAGLASMAVVDLVKNFLPEIYGEKFDNKRSNVMKGWLVSAPQVCSSRACVYLAENIVGRQNRTDPGQS